VINRLGLAGLKPFMSRLKPEISFSQTANLRDALALFAIKKFKRFP
jgi:hypothetical protein